MSLYFILLTASGAVPLLLSFDKRLQFYKQWKYVFSSILLVALVYIIFDVNFTNRGIWGFNPEYLSGIYLFSLPLEEILFFVVIPYASIFLHESIREYFPKLEIPKSINMALTIALIVLCVLIAVFNIDKSYTFYISLKLAVALLLALLLSSRIPRSFFITFIVILIPFLIVNGILTGSYINGEVVWYNNNENLGLRVFTIPVEDFAYAFSMILYNFLLIEQLIKWRSK
ncbi:lycopene cyclase domain-containing protein [Draconibacterium orientale]|jgi:lycopene cyclase domain-containing protein|uniref:Lycopene cyclase domain-containing protein n=1 Tax=Draconibacterium orientale TaxID=1168034 RepID=X5DYN1_9BACT|nr:lycopene cyclase domain-containing protein [Draconibacterium orientale]AHW60315.1 membrane protein [Draconibacterium orientale]SET96933.1 lycopene cyclase domain-containing protein [Draconibacterium orientale]